MRIKLPNEIKINIKRFDVIVVLLFLLAAGAFYGWNQYSLAYGQGSGKYVEIYSDNELYQKIEINDKTLTDKVRIKNKYGENVLIIRNGGVFMEEADCPDQICAKTGFIDKPGQSIVCLPNKLVVEIVANNESEDAFAADVVAR